MWYLYYKWCEHEGIAEHTKDNGGIVRYNELLSDEEFPTSGAYYLQEDYDGKSEGNVKEATLTNDLYVCLNGLTLSNVIFKASDYKLYITNCKEESADIVVPDDNFITNVKAEIISSKGVIRFTIAGLSNTNSINANDYKLYNISVDRLNKAATNENIINLSYNNNANKNLVISNVSIVNVERTGRIIFAENTKVNILKTKFESNTITSVEYAVFNNGETTFDRV